MKFADLTEDSQHSARNVLVNVLIIEFDNRGYVDEQRAKSIAHNIRKSFVALESEERLPVSDSDLSE